MADPINLNRFRKRRRRAAEREQADRNRVIHGRTKAQKQAVRRERERAEQLHAGHLRDSEGTGGDAGDDEPSS